MHADLTQRERLRRLDQFRAPVGGGSGKSTKSANANANDNATDGTDANPLVRVLVTTDVAARGLDVPDVTHVVHLNAPRDRQTFVHRTGRT